MDFVDLWELIEQKICQKTVYEAVKIGKTAKIPNQLFVILSIFCTYMMKLTQSD